MPIAIGKLKMKLMNQRVNVFRIASKMRGVSEGLEPVVESPDDGRDEEVVRDV